MSSRFDPKQLYRVTLKANPHYKKNGQKSYAYALNKYNIGPTVKGPFEKRDQVLVKRTADNQTGELTAEDIQWDAMYLAEVQIGTPKAGTSQQVLRLDFDTGSSDLWCWSSRLPPALQASAGSQHTIFNPANSETWKDLPGETFQIVYGDNSHVNGNVGTDTINLGGLVINGQAIETAENMSKQFQTGQGDGLLGLAFGTINTVQPHQQATPVDNMINENIIPQENRLFTAYLGSWRDAEEGDPDQGQSFYTFGYIDQNTVNATGQQIHWVDILEINASNGFWKFPSTSTVVNGQTIDLSGNTAIADTGTTLALVSDQVCQAVYDAVPGAVQDPKIGGWVFPIDTPIDQRPTVAFAVGDEYFAVEKEDLGFMNLGNGYAYGGIQSRGDLGFDILGDTFLKAVYAVFDQGNNRFGCVQRVDPTQTTDMPPVNGA